MKIIFVAEFFVSCNAIKFIEVLFSDKGQQMLSYLPRGIYWQSEQDKRH